MITPQVSGPAPSTARDVLLRAAAVVVTLWLILVILPALVGAAG